VVLAMADDLLASTLGRWRIGDPIAEPSAPDSSTPPSSRRR
jgi:hypothetical protein